MAIRKSTRTDVRTSRVKPAESVRTAARQAAQHAFSEAFDSVVRKAVAFKVSSTGTVVRAFLEEWRATLEWYEQRSPY